MTTPITEVETPRASASRDNAKKSTGPRTAAGKARASGNSTTHGLTAEKVIPDRLKGEAEKRMNEWVAAYRPRNEHERDIVEFGAMAMTRLRHCWSLADAARKVSIHRAAFAWEQDRQADADLLAAKMAGSPRKVVSMLSKTLRGAEYLREQWLELGQRLDHEQMWDDAQRSKALDLLGIEPAFRDKRTPIDYPGASPEEVLESLRELVAEWVETYTQRIDTELTRLDELARDVRLNDQCIFGDSDIDRLTRYERTLTQQVNASLDRLSKGWASDETKPSTDPIKPDMAPESPAVTIKTESGSALRVEPSLMPDPGWSDERKAEHYAEWIQSQTNRDVEGFIVPMVLCRIGQIREELERNQRQDQAEVATE